jgi:hypothetical protein
MSIRYSHAFHTIHRSNLLIKSTATIPKIQSYYSTSLSSNKDTTINDEQTITWTSRDKCWRPTVQDVERISWGKPAKKKGTGSRGVPHRLNHDEERKLFDQARKKGILEVNGSAWRSQRRDAPLLNSYRSLCDARGQVCIVLHKGNTGVDDELVIDLSPLRLPDTFDVLAKEITSFVDLDAENKTDLDFPDEVVEDESDESDQYSIDNDEDSLLAWEEKPIYQLSPYCISWKVERSEGKSWGKKLASIFNTAEPKASASKKPKHVKHGKNRRSGGYGIG